MSYQDDYIKILEEQQEQDAIFDGAVRVGKLLKNKVVRPPFPVDAFPLRLQAMMEGYYRVFGAAPDHYGLAMLTVAGMALGNTVRLVEPTLAEHPPIFYAALVAPPGSGKTPIIKTVIAPVIKRQRESLKQYRAMLEEAREEARRKKDEEVKVPPAEQPLVASFTMEALIDALQATPRGILIYRDELSAWINSMDQYKSKGDEKEFFLSAHNAGSHDVTRKNMDVPVHISSIMLGVLGGIQPGILETLTDSNSQSSGFLARILFSWPQRVEYRPYNNDEPDGDYVLRWERIVNALYDIKPHSIPMPPVQGKPLESKDVPHHIYLSSQAVEVYAVYYNDLQQRTERSESEVEASTLVKFRTHCLRIALVLHFLEYACELTENEAKYYAMVSKFPKEISGTTMEKAVLIARYFEATGLKVVGSIDDPAESLPENQKVWYKALPDEGTRKVAVELGKQAGVSSRTIDRLIKNRKDLFRKERGGKWSKV